MFRFRPISKRFFSTICKDCDSSCVACWNCKHRKSDDMFFCSHCGIIQEPDKNVSFFSIFSISKPTFEIDLAKLDQRYKFLMRNLHPDKFSMKGDHEAQLSFEHCSVITRAYQVLKDPHQRAKYLLKQLNLDVNEAKLDPDFLEEMMNMMEAASLEKEAEKIIFLKEHLEDESLAIEKNIQKYLESMNEEQLLKEVAKLSYMRRIHDSIQEKLDFH